MSPESSPCPRRFEAEAMRDGRLTGAELAGFARHLNACSACSREVAALDRLAEAIRASVRDRGGADELRVRRERTRLLAAFDRALVSSSERRPASQRWLLPGVAAGLVLFAAWFVFRHDGGAVLSAPPSNVAVRADTTAVWSRHTQGSRERIVLERGALFVRVDHSRRGKQLVVALPDGELEDIGTTFSVSAKDGRTARVSVQEGSVVLRIRDKAPVALLAGEVWTADASAPSAPPPTQVSVPTLDGGPDQRPSGPVQATQRRQPLAARSAPRQADSPDAALDFNAAMAAFDRVDCQQAAAGLARFITAHPMDPRTEDAAYLRVMAFRKCGDERAMKAAAASYLQRYPAGFRRLEVERLAR